MCGLLNDLWKEEYEEEEQILSSNVGLHWEGECFVNAALNEHNEMRLLGKMH